jgi:hypothetical protein
MPHGSWPSGFQVWICYCLCHSLTESKYLKEAETDLGPELGGVAVRGLIPSLTSTTSTIAAIRITIRQKHTALTALCNCSSELLLSRAIESVEPEDRSLSLKLRQAKALREGRVASFKQFTNFILICFSTASHFSAFKVWRLRLSACGSFHSHLPVRP